MSDEVRVRVPSQFPSNEDLRGRVALVTGAGRGLGRPIAHALAARGAAVVLCGRNREDLDETAAELVLRGAAVQAVPLDVRNPDSVQACVDAARRRFGRLDVLVNNAGIPLRQPAEAVSVEDWDKVMETNLRGPFLMARAAFPHLKESAGCIVNIASILGRKVHPALPIYRTSKGALIQLTRALAASWAPHRIRVNAVAPGFIDSPLNAAYKGTPREAEFMRLVPQGRWGEVEDVAGACVYLASPAAGFITGHVLYVDGGATII